MSTTVFLALAVRLLIALGTRTFFQPDEYFQALEPAHHLVYGYGHLTWEWLSPLPIRSIFYPALNVPVYWLLKVSGLDQHDKLGDLLVVGPRVLHGTLAAATDIWLCELTAKTIGQRYVSTALFLSLTSFFHGLSLSRSLSNSLETSLTTIALSYYPWDTSQSFKRSMLGKMLVFAALACAVRATNAVLWLFLILNLLWSLRRDKRALLTFTFDAGVTAVVTCLLLIGLDSAYYGRFTFTPLSFVFVNLSGVSLFYGGNPWHYYLSQALPILCTTSLPFVLDGIWTCVSKRGPATLTTLFRLLIWTIVIYSLAGHKEWRFIHPLLPILHVFAAKSLVDRSSAKKISPKLIWSKTLPIRRGFVWLILSTLPISAYIVMFYCSAPISVMSYVRSLPPEELQGGSIGFLMPCHSTPGHAYLHRPQLAHGGMWALGCEPPLQHQNASFYSDQTKVFYDDPLRYLQDRFPSQVNASFPLSPYPVSPPGVALSTVNPWAHEWPRHLIFFGALLEVDGVQDLLKQKGYAEIWRRGRSWEGDEDTRKGGVRVWKWLASL